MEDNEVKNVLIKNKKQNKGFGLLETIIIIVITAIISGITTGIILYNSYGENTGVSYSELTSDENLKEFLDIYSTVTEEYYEDVDKKRILEAAISAMMSYLGDNYSSYLDQSETSALSDTLVGKYKGIGVSFKDKTIIEVFKDSPASKAGIQSGDIIYSIDGDLVTEKDDTEIASIIKSKTSKITLEVKRNNKTIKYELDLDSLNVPAIDYSVKDKNIGYIYISTFSNTLAEQVKDALTELEKDNIKSLIIDVRDNAGGYLTAASDVANFFIEKNKPIYSLQAGTQKETYKDETEEHREYPIVVLINKNSASASEILAAALKESYGATLIGNVSYGKGKVQQTKGLSDGSMVKYTTAKWLTPKGNCIDGKGLTPDIEVDLKLKYENDEVVGFDDTQLQSALDYLNEKVK